MRRRHAGASTNPAARLPEFVVLVGCALLVFTGAWLWFVGETEPARLIRENDFADPFTLQVWIRRLHVAGFYGVAVGLVAVVLRALIDQQAWRMMFIVSFVGFFAIGAWSGYATDWDAARLWSETRGTRMRLALAVGEGPRLPDYLGRARLHISVVPAVMAMVVLSSLLRLRRR